MSIIFRGSLKGEMPKVQFEGLRAKIPQESVDALFQKITDSPQITYAESLSARRGLAKIFGEFGGGVPTEGELKLLGRVFPDEFIGGISQGKM